MSLKEKRICKFARCKNLVKREEKFCYEHREKFVSKNKLEKRKNQLDYIENDEDE